MSNEEEILESADGRYRLELSWPHSDHFMAEERRWRLIDTVSNRAVQTINSCSGDGEVQKVGFDKTGRFLILKNGYGKVLEEIDLVKLAKAADARRKRRAEAKKAK